jgi:hypothetical protein
MATANTIELPLPTGMQPTGLDLELIKATFQAIASLRCECGREWEHILRDLEGKGWDVNWKLTWIAEAKRGEHFESVRGATLDEAFAELKEHTHMATIPVCP